MFVQSRTQGELKVILDDEDGLSDMMMTHYKVPLKMLQDEVKIKAMQNPTGFMDDRKNDITELLSNKGPVVQSFKTQVDKYVKMGLPRQEAIELAMKASDQVYDTALEAYDLKYGEGYKSAFGLTNVKQISKLAEAKIADDSLTKDKKYYKNKYETKYQNKIQKQLGK